MAHRLEVAACYSFKVASFPAYCSEDLVGAEARIEVPTKVHEEGQL